MLILTPTSATPPRPKERPGCCCSGCRTGASQEDHCLRLPPIGPCMGFTRPRCDRRRATRPPNEIRNHVTRRKSARCRSSSRRDQWSAPDPAPDPHRFLRAVVEELDRRFVQQVDGVIVGPEVQAQRVADHPLGRYPIQLLGERAHEITIPTRGDVCGEPVGLQVPQQLDHRHERTGQVGTASCGCTAVRSQSPASAAKASTLIPSNARSTAFINTPRSASSPW